MRTVLLAVRMPLHVALIHVTRVTRGRAPIPALVITASVRPTLHSVLIPLTAQFLVNVQAVTSPMNHAPTAYLVQFALTCVMATVCTADAVVIQQVMVSLCVTAMVLTVEKDVKHNVKPVTLMEPVSKRLLMCLPLSGIR